MDNKGINIDFDNLMHMYQAQELYNTLKIKCHPDRFLEPFEIEKATALFQLISENKNNYKELLRLQKLAIEQLGINF